MSAPARNPEQQQRALAGVAFAFGVLALLVPLWPELAPERRIGVLLVAAAVLELYQGFHRASAQGQREAWFGGGVTLGLGVLLLNAPLLVGRVLPLLVGGWFLLDAGRYAIQTFRDLRTGQCPTWHAAAALGNLAVVLLLVLLGHRAGLWTVAIAAALRIFGTAANLLHASVFTVEDAGDTAVRSLGLPEHRELAELGDRLEAEERARSAIDRYWVWTFILTLFAIHLGRMGFDRTALGIIAPGFAVLGDLVLALAIGLGIRVPLNLLMRRLTRPIERRSWRWCLEETKLAGNGPGWPRRFVRIWLTRRLRFAVRMRQARYSLRAALGRGLQLGLPVAAIVAATTPIWGMSWYFDTENYAAGIWNAWAEARTDTWREAMIQAVAKNEQAAGRPAPNFAITPPGLQPGGDFAFVVIGDTGEGDASQHVLRDQLILAAQQPEVRFVVLSSDVVYPSGEMKDYEARFWLPFKGVTKPVYAIPGNHDWYDALEGFAATFLEPAAARTAMRARVEADLALTTTTDGRIDALIREAARLQGEYHVPTGFQQGPLFQVQTKEFALIAVDTGVRKRADAAELDWLKAALASARGKFTMVILGHPLYACGEYRATDNADFAALHDLLKAHDVAVVMAGDTHDFEYYAESGRGPGAAPMHHFVNGGGGAFLTFGAALADAGTFPTRDWAHYPAPGPLISKVETQNAFWKVPLWWWTKRLKAWPSAPEWLSAAFDYNVAPFFQSFVEVRVEPSARRVRLLPWGVHGRLRWSDLRTSPGLRPAAAADDAPVEWSIPMRTPGQEL